MPSPVAVKPGERHRDRRSEHQSGYGEAWNEQRPLEGLAQHLDAMQQGVAKRHVRERPLDDLVALDPRPEGIGRLARWGHRRRGKSAALRLARRVVRLVDALFWAAHLGSRGCVLDPECPDGQCLSNLATPSPRTLDAPAVHVAESIVSL